MNLGKTHRVEYWTWQRMLARCQRPTHQDYPLYGARGIKVCLQWQGRAGFRTFLRNMGLRPEIGMSLDRIDPNGHYEPTNCRWATAQQQAANRRYCHKVVVNGLKMTVEEAARQAGVSPMTFRHRVLRQGLSPEAAATVGPLPYRRNSRFVAHNGETLSVPEWAKRLGILARTLNERLRRGMPIERALTSGPLT